MAKNTPQTPQRKNTHYISNLRSSLTALVILHHAATTYGGEGSNTYQSSFHPIGSSAALVGFNAVNQSFFMGTFMYLAGHFSKKALERTTKKQFVIHRVWRLAVPSVLYTLVGAPMCVAIHRTWRGGTVDWKFLVDYWRGLTSLRGPVWFTGTLFCFDLALVGCRKIHGVLSCPEPKQPISPQQRNPVDGPTLLTSLALVSASDFLIRTIHPCGQTTSPLGLQPAYVSQYIASYIFGVYVSDIRDAVPSSPATLWSLRITSFITTTILARSLAVNNIEQMKGGFNTLSLTYAIWNNFFGYLLGSKLLQLFSAYWTESWGWINEAAFPAFLVHMPVLTAIGVLADKWRAGAVVKTAAIGTVTVMSSWVLGYAGFLGWGWVRKREKKGMVKGE